MSRGAQRCSLPILTRGLERGETLPSILAAAAPCLPFVPLLLRGETLWFRDFSLYFVPMKALLVDLWRSGELPLWDPYVRNGLPFLANPQAGAFYPPSLLLALFGLNPGLTFFILLHLAAAGAGAYRLLRSVRFATSAALLGAIAFALSGYVASLVNVLNNLQAAAWIPWILCFALRVAECPGPRAWLGLVAFTALSILGGELQLTALALGLAAALVAVVPRSRDPEPLPATEPVPEPADPNRFAAPSVAPAQTGRGAQRDPGSDPDRSPTLRVRARASGLVVLAALAALGLTAIQLVPTAELLSESVRRLGLPLELAADESLEPAALFSIAFPRPALPGDPVSGAPAAGAVPWLLSAYAGVAVVWLAILGVGGPRRRWTLFWSAAALTGLVLALGAHSVVFRWLHELVPPLRSVRYPQKFLLLTALGFPALAAAGMERVLARDISLRAIAAGGLAVLVSAAGALRWLTEPWRGPSASALLAAGLSAAVVGVVLGRARRGGLDPMHGAILLCTLTALDLGLWSRAVNPSIAWRFYDESWAAAVLARTGDDPAGYRVRSSPLAADMEELAVIRQARIFSNHYLFQQSMAPNLGELYGFLAQDGMAALETRGTADLIDELVARDPREGLRLLRLLGVRYLVTSLPLPPEGLEEVASHPELPLSVLRLRDPLPRAYVVGRWEVISQRRAAIRRALEPGFSPEATVVLDRAPAEPPSWSGGGEAGRAPGVVLRAAWEPSAARLEVDLDRPGILVVTDSHFPGWRAAVDGRRAPLLVANGYQRAVALPAGTHTVVLSYRPASLRWGAAISLLSAVLLAGGLVFTRPRRHAPRTDGTVPFVVDAVSETERAPNGRSHSISALAARDR